MPDEDCAGAVGLEFGLMRTSHDEEARGDGALVCGRGKCSYWQPVLEGSARSRIGLHSVLAAEAMMLSRSRERRDVSTDRRAGLGR